MNSHLKLQKRSRRDFAHTLETGRRKGHTHWAKCIGSPVMHTAATQDAASEKAHRDARRTARQTRGGAPHVQSGRIPPRERIAKVIIPARCAPGWASRERAGRRRPYVTSLADARRCKSTTDLALPVTVIRADGTQFKEIL